MRYFELFERFSEFSVDSLGLGDVIRRADQSLSGLAERAIDAFVGIPHNGIEMGLEGGIMAEYRLEDAFSPNPSEKGKQVKADITRAFAPVKAALKQKFGNTVKLYRRQADKRAVDRHTLSWTIDPEVAKQFAGVGKLVKPLSDAEIKQYLQTYQSIGKVKVGRYEYIRTDDPEYYDIYQNGELITDGDDLEAELKQRQTDQQELLAQQQQKLKTIIEADIDIDSIIWVTNRANQSEFIVRNAREHKWHIPGQ